MSNKKSIKSKIGTLIFTVILLIVLVKMFSIYKTYYYNDFIKAEGNLRQSVFTKDNLVKYSKNRSYKIESENYNDALFYKSIQVKPNTPYKVTCMVKTENVETEFKYSDSGAQICIINSTECSRSITRNKRLGNFRIYI